MKLDYKDFFTGAIYGLICCFYLGPWGLPITLLIGLLWALGGAGWLGFNSWRRVGVPFVLFLMFKWHNPSGWPYLGALATFGALSIGYGEPSTQPPDEGSFLGRIFGKWTRLVWWIIVGLATAIFRIQ